MNTKQINMNMEGINMTTEQMNMNIVIDGHRWFTYKQLARKLKVTHQTIFNRAKTGKIIKIDIDGTTFYRVRDAK